MDHFKRNSGLIFKSITAIVLLMGLSSPSVISLAKQVHHYHFRTSRHVKIHHYRHYELNRLKGRRSRRRTKRSYNYRVRKTCREIDNQTVRDINKDRQRRHLPKLRLNHRLSKISNERSHQIQSYFSHNFKRHQNELRYLLNQRKIRSANYGENIAASPLGTIDVMVVGKFNTPTNAHSQDITYRANNGYQLANNVNNASMYHDAGDNNGHRNNDLSRHYKQMGIGVSYDHIDQNYYMAIEFIG